MPICLFDFCLTNSALYNSYNFLCSATFYSLSLSNISQQKEALTREVSPKQIHSATDTNFFDRFAPQHASPSHRLHLMKKFESFSCRDRDETKTRPTYQRRSTWHNLLQQQNVSKRRMKWLHRTPIGSNQHNKPFCVFIAASMATSLPMFVFVSVTLLLIGVIFIILAVYDEWDLDQYLAMGAFVSFCFSAAVIICYLSSRLARPHPNPIIFSKRYEFHAHYTSHLT